MYLSPRWAACLLFANFTLFDVSLQYPENLNALVAQALLCVSLNENGFGTVLTGFDQCVEMLKSFGFVISGIIPVAASSILHNRFFTHSFL